MRHYMEAEALVPPEHHNNGLTEVLTNEVLEVNVKNDNNGTDLLYSLLSAPWLQSLLKVYDCLQNHQQNGFIPHQTYASDLLQQVLADLQGLPDPSPHARELRNLIKIPDLQAILAAHDTVARKEYDPVLPPLPTDLPVNEEAMRIVCLVKNNQPLGATIKRNELTGEIIVARVIRGGLADRSGLLNAGDRLVEVNWKPVQGLDPEEIVKILAHSHSTIMFKLVPVPQKTVDSRATLFMRAMVDYSPQKDPTIPCADAGMAFCRRDVLEVVDQTDVLWWQARKLPSSSACAGLIPSISLLRSKQRELWWSQPFPSLCSSPSCDRRTSIQSPFSCMDEVEDIMAIDDKCVETDEEAFESEELREDEGELSSAIDGIYLAGFRHSLRLCRRKSQTCPQLSCSSIPVEPYEQVARYQRQPQDKHRLIALVGPSGVGVNELRRRLIESSPRRFRGAVPHTTRPPKCYEESGREYHFITKELFNSMVEKQRFLEHGEFKGHMYGTSADSVKDILSKGMICIVDIEPNAIPMVRTQELRAYIIYVKPPSMAWLRRTRKCAQVITNYYATRPFKDEDFQEMEEIGRKMEIQFGQFFDCVLINDHLHDSCAQLLLAIQQAQEEPQWVPACWDVTTGNGKN